MLAILRAFNSIKSIRFEDDGKWKNIAANERFRWADLFLERVEGSCPSLGSFQRSEFESRSAVVVFLGRVYSWVETAGN